MYIYIHTHTTYDIRHQSVEVEVEDIARSILLTMGTLIYRKKVNAICSYFMWPFWGTS
jgi:hypothetical protein